jgi:ubiquinone/menaquinone biosynthesis C-methylase UbiE/tetratricopeptide (TPR) repeat protein
MPSKMDYLREYTDYWSRPDRFGTHSFADPRPIAAQVIQSCGIGSVLDVGSGMGLLVQTLVREGIDAHGMDIAPRVVDHCNGRMPGRFTRGTVLELPFPDGSFDTIMSTDCLEHIAPEDIPTVLAEMRRVSRRGLFLRVATKIDRDARWHLSIHEREWWEEQLFDAGFRKHPRYYAVLPYEALENEPMQIAMAMEKSLSQSVMSTDMLRQSGRKSDAVLARYQLAAGLVRPGDRVLDVGCGAGDGTYLIRQNSLARQAVGIDGDESAVQYAADNFKKIDSGLEYRHGVLPDALSLIPNESFDLITSFRAFDLPPLLAHFRRILRPGGRVILSAGCPFERILRELPDGLIADNAWQQTAGVEGKWAGAARRMQRFDPNCQQRSDGECCIVAAMKSPLNVSAKTPYGETIFANVASAESPVGRYGQSYENPWLVHSLVNIGYRLHSPLQLAAMARQVLKEYSPTSADAGAALCILAYRAVEQADLSPAEASDIAAQAAEYLKTNASDPHVLRWQISLAFVMGRIWLTVGEIDRAIEWFMRCASMDSLAFSPHLATKTAEAFYEAGRLTLRQKREQEAQRIWAQGLEFGRRLLAVPLEKVLVNPDYPNLFDHGDGMREFTLALDFLTRCANGIHLLQRQREGFNVDWQSLDRSFRWLTATLQENLSAAQATVAKLTAELETTREQLISRTSEVDATRTDLESRTVELDRDREELRQRSLEVDAARKDLIERTAEVTADRQELLSRTAEVNAARKDLADRTNELNAARKELIDRTAELDMARKDLIDRTVELDIARKDLIDRTIEVDEARKDLLDRTVQLDEARAKSKRRRKN